MDERKIDEIIRLIRALEHDINIIKQDTYNIKRKIETIENMLADITNR